MGKAAHSHRYNEIVPISEVDPHVHNSLHNITLSEVRDHEPKEHTHVEADITDLEHDAQKIKGKEVDDSNIGDNKLLAYKASSGKIEYVSAGAGTGDMLKSVYDVDEDGKVDVAENSELLDGSTKTEVQDHPPREHGNESHNPDFISVESDPTVDGSLKSITLTQVRDHPPKTHGNEAHTSSFITGTQVPSFEADPTVDSKISAHASLPNIHHSRSHDHSLTADGSPIAVSGVPDLPATKITSGTFDLGRIPRIDLARMPLGSSGHFLKGQGASDPVYSALVAGDIPSLDASKITTGRFTAARMLDGASGHFLKAQGIGVDPVYALLVEADIPSLSATKITSGQFPLARLPRDVAGRFIRSAGTTSDPTYSLLTPDDIPSLDTSKITTGVFGVARGGTGLSSLATGGILYISDTNTLSRIAPTAANQVLRSTGANALTIASLTVDDIPTLPSTKVGLGNVTNDAQLKRAAGDFNAFTTKTTPASTDIILIEDSADAFNKKKITVGSLPTGGAGTVERDLHYYRKVGTTQYEAWFTSPKAGTALAGSALTANRLYAMPFPVPRTITLDRIGINVTTGATGSARLGIYTNSETLGLYPDQLVVDAGTVDTGTTGVKTLTINQTLTSGMYWLVLVTNAGASINCIPVAAVINVLGHSSALGTAQNCGLFVSFTFGTLPATFPSTPTMITAAPIPAIFVRLSA